MSVKEFIDHLNEIQTFLDALKTSTDDEEKLASVFEAYAGFLDLQDEIKVVLKEFRNKFHLKEADVKKWMKEQEEPEDNNKEEKK